MTKNSIEFDFDKALKGIQEGKPFTGKDGVLTSLIKNLAEAAFEAELDSHLAQEVAGNRRNGRTKKTIKSLDGKFELETPRDKNGTFSPKIVKKHQTTLSDEIEQKIIAIYGLGMSLYESPMQTHSVLSIFVVGEPRRKTRSARGGYNDISAHLKEIYGLEISNATLSTITDKIIHTVKEWQVRFSSGPAGFFWWRELVPYLRWISQKVLGPVRSKRLTVEVSLNVLTANGTDEFELGSSFNAL